MPKIRIREVVINGERKPTVPGGISLGSVLVQEPKTIKARNMQGQEVEQYIPGRSVNRWLMPAGRKLRDTDVEVADVDEATAAILVDDRGWCERMPGRPKREPEIA